MSVLFRSWVEAKAVENEAIERRRSIEAELEKELKITDDWEGSYTMKEGIYKVVIKRAFAKKVDTEKLQEIANKNGWQSLLVSLFRWKAEVDAKAWKNAPDEVTNVLAQAITTTPGKVSFKIEEEEK